MTVHDPKAVESPDTPASQFGPEQKLKLAIEFGPLLVLFATNFIAGQLVANHSHAILWGTGAFVVATIAALVVSHLKFGRIDKVPIFTAAIVAVFGGLTLWLQDDFYIKLKPTIVFILFAMLLGGGLLAGKIFLKRIFGAAMDLTDTGWRILTLRWTFFFLILAGLNEVVWRNFSTDFWVTYKVFGVLPLMMVFAMFQARLLERHGKQT